MLCVMCYMLCVVCYVPLCQGLRTQPSRSCPLRACEISSCQAEALRSIPDVDVVDVDYYTIFTIKCRTCYQFWIIRVIGSDRGWQLQILTAPKRSGLCTYMLPTSMPPLEPPTCWREEDEYKKNEGKVSSSIDFNYCILLLPSRMRTSDA